MVRSFMDQMDRLFDDFTGLSLGRSRRPDLPSARSFSGLGQGSQGQSMGFWYPQVEVSEKGGNLVVCADLPGLRKEDVHLEVHDDYLVLEGERRSEREENQEGLYRTERSYGRFYRTIPLPEGTDPDQVRASFRDGVLEVTVPMPSREEQQRGRRIEIQ
jgi:HSP20 family protein